MTADRIITLLKESGADAWRVSDVTTEGWEFYFIRHRLDQNRVRDVEHIHVTVYRRLEDGGLLGSADGEIAPTATDGEARAEIARLNERAAYVRNPVYALNRGPVACGSAGEETDPAETAKKLIETMRAIRETDGEDINSYEIFAERNTRRLVTSEGIDVTEHYPLSSLEVVVNARDGEREIELYRLFHAGTCDQALLSEEIGRLLVFGRDRLAAKPTPALGSASVLLSTGDAVSLYRYFASKVNAGNKYQRFSDWEIGVPYAGELRGDAVTLEALRTLPNSSKNRAVDAEGAPVRDLVLIENGVPSHFWGSQQFRSYLDVGEGFIAENFAVRGGSGTEETLRAGAYLEVVEFSEFEVDDVTGDIAGEIRLAYWHDGEKTVPVSGGSISGSLRELAGEMRFSGERRQYDNWLIPRLTRLEGVHVTGIGQI